MKKPKDTSNNRDEAEIIVSKDGCSGSVKYIEGKIIVDFPNESIASEIKKYFSKPKKFTIPNSDELDDYRNEEHIPCESKDFFVLASCELCVNTDVHVEKWKI